jgi:hypothetical protein
MTLQETAAILAMIAAVDSRRSFGEIDVTAWHAFIGGFMFDDAREAVIAHYKESPHSILPTDVCTRVGAVRRARIGNRVAPLPPVDANDVRAYQDWIGAWFTAIADGLDDKAAEAVADAKVGVKRQVTATAQRDVNLSGLAKRPE